jgi:hypothetical protein
MISFKIENLPDGQRKAIDDWANEQSNIQQSLANLIMHVTQLTGKADVMDFKIQRQLHLIFGNAVSQLRTNPTPEPKVNTTITEVIPNEKPSKSIYEKADWFD